MLTRKKAVPLPPEERFSVKDFLDREVCHRLDMVKVDRPTSAKEDEYIAELVCVCGQSKKLGKAAWEEITKKLRESPEE